MNLVKGGQGRAGKDVKETGTMTGWLVLAMFVLLTACAFGGEPLKNVKGPEVKTVDPQSVVSDETKLAIPEEKEIKELADHFKRTLGKGVTDLSAQNAFHDMTRPLAADPEAWTDADYSARLKVEVKIMKVWCGVGQVHSRIGMVWHLYAAEAKTAEHFVKRVKAVKTDWPGLNVANDTDCYVPSIKKAVILFLQKSDDKLPTLEKKKAFIL
jgi:hypothetical protein